MSDAEVGSKIPQINVLFSLDRNYWQHFAVALLSLLETVENSNLNVIVFVDARHSEHEAEIERMAGKFSGVRLNFCVVDMTAFAHFRIDEHITLASYFRLFLADLLDLSITKVIYLDCDLVVRHNLLGLWDTDVSRHYMAAVPDPYSDKHVNLGFAASDTVFNAGVLVINVARWREEKLTDRFVSYVEANAAILRYHDQDVLNAVLKGGILPLAYTWNFQARMGVLPYRAFAETMNQYKALKNDPAIVHYTTNVKPWQPLGIVNYRSLYFDVLARTPWHGKANAEKSIFQTLARVLHPNNIRRALKWYAPNLIWLIIGKRRLRKRGPSCSYQLTLLGKR